MYCTVLYVEVFIYKNQHIRCQVKCRCLEANQPVGLLEVLVSRDSSFVFVLKTKEYKKNDLMCVLDLIVNKDRLVQ